VSEETFIEWTDHTGGPWLLCTEVSPGCAECYARELIETRLAPLIRKAYFKAGFADWETRAIWGKTAPRVRTKGFWREAYRFNAKAEKERRPTTIFPSLIDWLDEMPAGAIDQEGNWIKPVQLRADFLNVVAETKWINWLLLTKRPEQWLERITEVFEFTGKDTKSFERWAPAHLLCEGWLAERDQCRPPANVAVGVRAENQDQADKRIGALVKIPAAVRFLSCEPLLGPEDIAKWLTPDECGCGGPDPAFRNCVDFVIAGGESGTDSRVCRLAWLRGLVAQCQAAGVRVFVKQLGGNLTDEDLEECCRESGRSMLHPKGGDMAEWPPDLRVRDAWPEMGGHDPRVNVYVCEDSHMTVTVDVDDGVTPFMLGCRQEGCDHFAQSSMYPRGEALKRYPAPAWEWFKPSPEELRGMDAGMREHCEMGGLDIRARTDRRPVYHEDA
jgi:protein gp37